MLGTSNRVVFTASAAGAAVGLAASLMLGAAHLASGDYHITQSSDGKAVYVWSVGGDGSVEFVSSARTKHEPADDKGKKGDDGSDDTQDDKKGKAPADPGEKGKGKDKENKGGGKDKN